MGKKREAVAARLGLAGDGEGRVAREKGADLLVHGGADRDVGQSSFIFEGEKEGAAV